MSPLAFTPMPLPRHASALFWATLVGMIVFVSVLEHRGKPRSIALWTGVGYLAGLFAGQGDLGGLAGAAAGALVGLLASKT